MDVSTEHNTIARVNGSSLGRVLDAIAPLQCCGDRPLAILRGDIPEPNVADSGNALHRRSRWIARLRLLPRALLHLRDTIQGNPKVRRVMDPPTRFQHR